jgi:hypothetical protein
MPAKSESQKRLMDAAAHNPEFAKKVGIPSKVAKDFSEASVGMKFKKGGAESQAARQSINQPKTNHGDQSLFSKGGKTMAKADLKKLFKGKESYKEEVAEAKAIKSGKITPSQYAKGEKMEESKKMARGGGVEVKGKTKGKMVVMKRGGKC